MFDTVHEECGLFGIFDPESKLDVSHITYTALYALQHRGQESCGIVVNKDGTLYSHKDSGLVNEVFNEMVLKFLQGNIAVGHVRYATSSTRNRENVQPYISKHTTGQMAFAHNGSIVNSDELRDELARKGALLQSSSDAEIIAFITSAERLHTGSTEQALIHAMDKLSGAYSVVAVSTKKMFAMRDPHGFRPLCMGRLGSATIFASESCAIDSAGGEFIRDLLPGEVISVTKDGIKSFTDKCTRTPSLCVFEHIYFARPDSVIDGASVHLARQLAGECLARENPAEADVVVGVPDSGIDAAIGYSKYSGIPYELGLIKNRYIGRTFIQTEQGQRENSVRIKLNPLSHVLKNKRVVLVDDSIVRGTTSAKLVKLIREAGAKEVHFRVSSPPFLNPCYFGTDIDSRDKLIACRMTKDEICESIGADSLGYLPVSALGELENLSNISFCKACFNGEYPVDIPGERK